MKYTQIIKTLIENKRPVGFQLLSSDNFRDVVRSFHLTAERNGTQVDVKMGRISPHVRTEAIDIVMVIVKLRDLA